MMERPRSLLELLEKQYGLELTWGDQPVVASIGTTDAIIARLSPRRLGLVIVNLSANTVYIRPMAPASSSVGILLDASGGAASMTWLFDLILPMLEWHGIASGAGSAIYVLEVLIK